MSEQDTSRRVVKTYVPAYQKAAWVEDAEAMDMSQSEFVRTMVQAGRASFDLDTTAAAPEAPTDAMSARTSTESAGAPGKEALDATGGESFDRRVKALLSEGPMTWEDLLEALTEDVEERLEDALTSLQSSNEVMYSGRNGGYEVIEE